MGIIFLQNKVKCAICGKSFRNFFCAICHKREYGLCNYCHNRSKNHIEELKNVRKN